MFRLRRTVVIAVAAAAVLSPALAACEAGAGAQTSRPYNPTDGASTVLHDIAIRNVFILGAAPGQALPAGQPAGLFLGLVNSGAPDRLVEIVAPGTASSVKLPHGTVTLPMNQPALLTGPVPQVILQRLTRPLTTGSFVPVILYFQNAGTIALNVPVIARSQFYTTYSEPPSPTPTVTRTSRAAPATARTARATPGVASTRTATPSASPTP